VFVWGEELSLVAAFGFEPLGRRRLSPDCAVQERGRVRLRRSPSLHGADLDGFSAVRLLFRVDQDRRFREDRLTLHLHFQALGLQQKKQHDKSKRKRMRQIKPKEVSFRVEKE
jgi:hypothetical protein